MWQASEDDRQIDADAYHIWTPRPLIRSVYWRPEPEPPREAVSGSYEVFIDQRVFATMHEHVWQAEAGRTPFGYLIGDLCEDPAANRRFVIVTAAVPARFPFHESGKEQIDAEASVALQLEVERRRGVQVGWYHSHPSGDAVLSAEDVATHERLFPEPWQVAILFLCDPGAPAGACFRRTPDGFDGELRLPFYEMVTNESLLAKGVRRSRVDWENVSTLDKIRTEPLPRPEAPPDREPAVMEPDVSAEADVAQVAEEPAAEPEPAVGTDSEPEPAESVVAEPEPAESPDPEPSEPAASVTGEEEEEELDLDALIAEVESAGLPKQEDEAAPEPDGEVVSEPVEMEPLDLEAIADVEVEIPDDLATSVAEVADFEVELEPDEAPVLEPAGEPDAAEVAPAPDEAEVSAEADAAEVAPELEEAGAPLSGPEDEDLPPSASSDEASERPAVDVDVALEELGDVEAELSLEESGVIAEPAPPAEEPLIEPAPAPDVADGGRRRRNWILGAVGIVIALGTVGVLLQFLGGGAGTQDAPAPIEQPAEDPVEEPADPTPEPEAGQPGADGAAPAQAATAGDADAGGAGGGAESISLAELEALSDRVLQAISTYYGRDGSFSRGEIECAELQEAFVEVMDSWIDYSTRGKAGWQGRLPEDLVERDERLYLGVQDVERLLEASACPRP